MACILDLLHAWVPVVAQTITARRHTKRRADGRRVQSRGARVEVLEQRSLLSIDMPRLALADSPDSTHDHLAFDGILPAGSESPEQGVRYRNFEEWGGTWHDAEKDTAHGGSLMCWAASASNVLRWTGWGLAGGQADPDQMFQYYKDHWSNLGGLPRYGFRWWFDGRNTAQGWPDFAQVVTPGGNFYPSVAWTAQVHSRGQSATARTQAMADIDQYLRAGYGVAIGLFGSIQHAVTVWGFNYDPAVPSSDPNYYRGIWISDSDDNKNTPEATTAPDTLHYYAVRWDAAYSRWSFEAYYAGTYIGEVDGLDRPVPRIAALGASPPTVSAGASLTLVAEGVSDARDPELSSVNVAFYRETNGVAGLQAEPGGDLLVGTDFTPAEGWSMTVSTAGLDPGEYIYYAQALDTASGWTSLAGTTAVAAISGVEATNSPPLLADQTLIIAEHSAVGSVVGTVAASDADDPPQILTYSIAAGDEEGIFAMDAASGRISVANAQLLDYEASPAFHLTVRARDNGEPALESFALVTVALTDLQPAVIVGDLHLLPDTPGQVRGIHVSSADYVAGLTFNLRVGDGLDPGNAPKITAIDVLGSAEQPTIFTANNSGQRDPDPEPDGRPYCETRQTTTASGTVLADGVLALVTFDTSGVLAGAWDLVLADPLGVPTDFAGGVANLSHGTLRISQAPVAVEDFYGLPEDGVLDVPAPGLKSNDTVAEGDALLVNVVAPPSHAASFTWSEDGAFHYAPAADWNGADSFRYRVFDGRFWSDESTVQIEVTPVADVLGRYVFYNNSAWDGNTPGADAPDDMAIAPPPGTRGHGHAEPLGEADKELGKEALLPGQTASFRNYTSYSKGINGIMIDLDHLGDPDALGADDFQFRVGNDNAPAGWMPAPPPAEIAVRALGGGVYRVTIVWPDHDPLAADPTPLAVANAWLAVEVLATPQSGLARPDVFYFGNAIGETGNSPTNAYVNPTDEIGARQHPHAFGNLATLGDPYDFDRDKRVNPTDEIIARLNPTAFGNSLKLISVPAAEDAMPGDGAAAAAGNAPPELAAASFTLPEHSPLGTLVGTVLASDPDGPPEALSYSIVEGNPGVFAIDARSGRITVASREKLDYETARTFRLTVLASDEGAPPQSTAAEVLVQLTNVRATIVLGDMWLLPDTPGQTRQVFVGGEEFPFGLTLNLRVADGLEGGQGPRIAGIDILGTADEPTIFHDNHSGPVDPDGEADPFPRYETAQISTADGTVLGSGRLARVTFDTTGVAAGRWDLVLADPDGVPTDFAGDAAEITNGSLIVDRAPLARAGDAYLIGLGSELRLDASASFDPDAAAGDAILSYAWDLDNDGQYDDLLSAEPLASVPFTDLALLGLGEGNHVIGLSVVDRFGLAGTAAATLDIRGSRLSGSMEGEPIRIAVASGAPGQVDVFLGEVGATADYAVLLEQIAQWQAPGSAAADRLSVDFSQGNPLPAGGLMFAGGPGDRLTILGTSAEDTVMVTAGEIRVRGPTILETGSIQYGSAEFLDFALGAGQDLLHLDGAVVRLGVESDFSAQTAIRIDGGGELDLGGRAFTVREVSLPGGSVSNGILLSESHGLEEGTVRATLGGTGGLTKSGEGTVVLSAPNTYEGGTTVVSGTLVVLHGESLPSGGGLRIGGGGTVVLSGSLTTVVAVGEEAEAGEAVVSVAAGQASLQGDVMKGSPRATAPRGARNAAAALGQDPGMAAAEVERRADNGAFRGMGAQRRTPRVAVAREAVFAVPRAYWLWDMPADPSSARYFSPARSSQRAAALDHHALDHLLAAAGWP